MPYTATPDHLSPLARELPAMAQRIETMRRVSPAFAALAAQFDAAAEAIDRIEAGTPRADELPALGLRKTCTIMMLQIRPMLGL